VPELATPPLTRRALRELERSAVPRRKRVLGHPAPAAAESETARPRPAASAVPAVPQAPQPVRTGAGFVTSIPAPLPAATPARVKALQEAAATRSRKRFSARGPLSVAAFFFAAGLAVTSVVPMLALGQSSTAAAATVVSVQDAGRVQQWQAAMTSTGPSASLDAASAALARANPVFNGAAHANTFTNNVNWAIQWPFPFGVPISSPYGPRIAPTEGASSFHKGIDFTPGAGTPIQAIDKGVVSKIVTDPHAGLGIEVDVDHGVIDGHDIVSVYGEMAPGSVKVAMGQQVEVGDIVGLVGISGISTGAHLHFELHVDGQPVDPAVWLRAHAG